jgi:hypothetical protein
LKRFNANAFFRRVNRDAVLSGLWLFVSQSKPQPHLCYFYPLTLNAYA